MSRAPSCHYLCFGGCTCQPFVMQLYQVYTSCHKILFMFFLLYVFFPVTLVPRLQMTVYLSLSEMI